MTLITAWIVLWPALTAAASLGYQALEHDTRGHAVLSALASLGLDLPKLWDALGRMLTGGGSGGGGGDSTSTQTPPKKPQTPSEPLDSNHFSWVEFGAAFAWASVFTVVMAVAGCSKLPAVAPSTPSDIKAVVDCVMADVIAGHPVDDCEQKFGPVLVEDALQSLLDSNVFSDEHPEATAYTRAQLKASHAGAHR